MMMMKIKTDKQLGQQKKRLKKRQQELETLLHADWIELKQTLKPKNIAGDLFSQAFQHQSESSSSIVAESLSKIAALFTKVAVEKAEEYLNVWVNKKH